MCAHTRPAFRYPRTLLPPPFSSTNTTQHNHIISPPSSHSTITRLLFAKFIFVTFCPCTFDSTTASLPSFTSSKIGAVSPGCVLQSQNFQTDFMLFLFSTTSLASETITADYTATGGPQRCVTRHIQLLQHHAHDHRLPPVYCSSCSALHPSCSRQVPCHYAMKICKTSHSLISAHARWLIIRTPLALDRCYGYKR